MDIDIKFNGVDMYLEVEFGADGSLESADLGVCGKPKAAPVSIRALIESSDDLFDMVRAEYLKECKTLREW